MDVSIFRYDNTQVSTPTAEKRQALARMVRWIIAFVVTAAAMDVVGSATHSYFVQRAWSIAAGHAYGTAPVAIPLADRLQWAAHDIWGMAGSYALTTTIALFLAFLLAGLVARFSGGRFTIFALAGAVSICVMFIALKVFLGTVGVFGARGGAGLAAQMLAGLLCGLLFARLTESSPARR